VTRKIEDDRTVEDIVRPAFLGRRDQLTLLVVSGPDAGHWHVVPPTGGTIGRKSEATIAINDPAISREHAAITVEGDEYVIHDRGSRNGLFVQGRRVRAERLREGDQVQLSTATVLRARYRGLEETVLLDEIQRAASTDALTGVYNRHYLMSRLDQEVSFTWRHHVPMSVLMLDLDRFKPINDVHGHQVGDRVLQSIGKLLTDTCRVEDVVARYGGDEFVVIARGYGVNKATQFAGRLCAAARTHPIDVGEGVLRVTLSIGVAGCEGQDLYGRHIEPIDLLGRADTALYRSKHGGRDRVTTWQPPPEPEEPKPQDWLRSTYTDLVQVDDE